MPLSRSLAAYYDVQQVFMTARKNGGIRYTLESEKAAIRWRQRAYYYRALLAKSDQEAHANVAGYLPSTVWDDVYLQCQDNVVLVTFGTLRGTITSLDGEALPLEERPNPRGYAEADPLLSSVLDFANIKGTD